MLKPSNMFLLFSSVLRANNYILDIFVQIIGLLTSSSKNKVQAPNKRERWERLHIYNNVGKDSNAIIKLASG
jgi:hypothetical protein